MVSPDQSPEDPRVINISIPTMGIEGQIRFDNPAMDSLTPEQRELLIRAAKTQTLALGLAIELKPDMDINAESDRQNINIWELTIRRLIEEANESIGNIENEIIHGPLSVRLLTA